MGTIQHVAVASFSGLQAKMFTVPINYVGIRGIFVRGANLSKALIEASDGVHKSTIPARDIITQGDPEPILDSDFVTLNWSIPPGTTIDVTPTTSSATVGHVYVLFAHSLSESEIEVKNVLFTNTATEPIDMVQVPDSKTVLEWAFIRGPDLEVIKMEAENQTFSIPCRNSAVNVDPLPYSIIKMSLPLSPKTMIKAIAVTHGTGGSSDGFFAFRA